MIRAQLRDTITLVSTLQGSGRPEDVEVPAHVFTVSSVDSADPLRPSLVLEKLRCMIGPVPGRTPDPAYDRIVHKGIEYKMDGAPMGRYRRGKIHHWTINLERAA